MCSRFLKVFFILVLVCFVFSVTCVSSNAVFYEENGNALLDYAGLYGGYYIHFYSDVIGDIIGWTDVCVWVPNNYKDNFSSDDKALVNISNTTMTLRAYDPDNVVHTIRVPAYSYMQIRTDSSPYYYYDIDDMQIIDTNIHIIGEKSPFYNANPAWSYDTKCICLALGVCTLFLCLVGVINVSKSRS